MSEPDENRFFDGASKEIEVYAKELPLIWSSDIVESSKTSIDLDDRKANTNYKYYADVAYKLPQLEIVALRRLWEVRTDGKHRHVHLPMFKFKFVRPGEPRSDLPEAFGKLLVKYDYGQTRGSILFFNRMPLDQFGDRIPQLAAHLNMRVQLW